MAPKVKVKTRADFPKGPKGTAAFNKYTNSRLSKLYRQVKGKKVAKNVLKIGSRSKLLGRGLLAAQMFKTGKDALKPWQKGPDGKRRGIAGVIQRVSQNTSKKDKEMRDKGYVKNSRGRWVKKKVNKVEKTVNKQESKINKVDPKQFDSRRSKKVESNNKNNEKKVVENNKLKIKSTTKGGPVKDGVEYARSKGDDLAGYRRGEGTKLGKDTRITKKLKKSGFTEDRLARLRKKNAEFQAAKKDKKKMKAYREKYGKR